MITKNLWNGHIWLHLQTLKIQTFLIETDQLKNELGSLSTPMSPHSKSPRTPKLWSSCQRYETSCRTSNILLKGSYLQSLAQGVATNFNRLKSSKKTFVLSLWFLICLFMMLLFDGFSSLPPPIYSIPSQ